jgi:hypothetical protein
MFSHQSRIINRRHLTSSLACRRGKSLNSIVLRNNARKSQQLRHFAFSRDEEEEFRRAKAEREEKGLLYQLKRLRSPRAPTDTSALDEPLHTHEKKARMY